MSFLVCDNVNQIEFNNTEIRHLIQAKYWLKIILFHNCQKAYSTHFKQQSHKNNDVPESKVVA